MAPAVLTFLTEESWQGKTVIPFMTNGGWPGHVIKDMKAACKDAQFICEMQVKFDSTGGAELKTPQCDIDKWIEQVSQALKEA